MLKLKLFAVAAFAIFTLCAFLLSSNKIAAQTSEKTQNRDEILQKVTDYKVWKQVQKPEKKVEDVAKTDVLTVVNSTAMG
jgi:hypothetical protein